MSEARFRKWVGAAIAAPSVHNVQPARWRIDGPRLILLEDRTRRLNVGDPTGHDAAISLGAAAEAVHLAASLDGIRLTETPLSETPLEGGWGHYRQIAAFHPAGHPDVAAPPDPLAHLIERRASWRGPFRTPQDVDRARASQLAAPDRTIITAPAAIDAIARAYDAASYGFMRRGDFRAELRGWMRLRRRHPRWASDGLNAEAMQLSGIEALGAGAVLGPLFPPLAALGLAPALLAERGAFANAVGIALFHRPEGESPYVSGRHFHRLWLEIEQAGMGANVLAALADDRDAAAEIARQHGLPPGHRLVSAFRFGLRDGKPFPRARLTLDEVLLSPATAA